MIFLNNKDLIGSPNKTSNKENLFDFIKNRVKISLCVSEKFVLKPSFAAVSYTHLTLPTKRIV